MTVDATFLEAIDTVLSQAGRINPGDDTAALERECIATAINILEGIYGVQSLQVQQFLEAIRRIDTKWPHTDSGYFVAREVCGSLTAARTDVARGRLRSAIERAASEILIDFVLLAERALDEGRIDVASVLIAAAFEDSVRRKALNAGLDVIGKDLSDLINALKASALLSKPQAQVAASYVTFRNKALHADWTKLGAPEVAGLISFVKHFAAGIPT